MLQSVPLILTAAGDLAMQIARPPAAIVFALCVRRFRILGSPTPSIFLPKRLGMNSDTRFWKGHWFVWPVVGLLLLILVSPSLTQPRTAADKEKDKTPPKTSYDQIAPVLIGQESFKSVVAKDKSDKPAVMRRQQQLLEERYDLGNHPDKSVTMTRGKPIQVGPAARLPDGMTWEKLAALSSEEIRDKGLFPKGFLPLPHPKHEAGGMVFPQMEIKKFPRLERFDVDFDLPEHFLPEYPPAIFLTTRPDLGDVSQGKVISVDNFQEIFAGILNAKDLEGVRLLVTQFPQQQLSLRIWPFSSLPPYCA